MDNSHNPGNFFPTPSGDFVPVEERERYTLGREGKLWSIEFEYEVDGEYCSQKRRNLINPEVMNLRKAVFQFGLLHFVEKGSFRIIMPREIKATYLDRQSAYFNG